MVMTVEIDYYNDASSVPVQPWYIVTRFAEWADGMGHDRSATLL